MLLTLHFQGRLITTDITYMNMKVAWVPGDWHIVMQGFKEINCKDRYTDRTSKRQEGYHDYCFDAAWGNEGFQSAKYQFLEGNFPENALAEAEPAGNCSLPNALFLDGGISYSLDGLDEDARNQTVRVQYRSPRQATDQRLVQDGSRECPPGRH